MVGRVGVTIIGFKTNGIDDDAVAVMDFEGSVRHWSDATRQAAPKHEFSKPCLQLPFCNHFMLMRRTAPKPHGNDAFLFCPTSLFATCSVQSQPIPRICSSERIPAPPQAQQSLVRSNCRGSNMEQSCSRLFFCGCMIPSGTSQFPQQGAKIFDFLIDLMWLCKPGRAQQSRLKNGAFLFQTGWASLGLPNTLIRMSCLTACPRFHMKFIMVISLATFRASTSQEMLVVATHGTQSTRRLPCLAESGEEASEELLGTFFWRVPFYRQLSPGPTFLEVKNMEFQSMAFGSHRTLLVVTLFCPALLYLATWTGRNRLSLVGAVILANFCGEEVRRDCGHFNMTPC